VEDLKILKKKKPILGLKFFDILARNAYSVIFYQFRNQQLVDTIDLAPSIFN